MKCFIRTRLPLAEKARAEGATGDVAYELALHCAYLGEIEEAFGWLEEALHQRSNDLFWIVVHPWLDSIRPDPRYREILKKAGFR